LLPQLNIISAATFEFELLDLDLPEVNLGLVEWFFKGQVPFLRLTGGVKAKADVNDFI